jgi:hypothetical protein
VLANKRIKNWTKENNKNIKEINQKLKDSNRKIKEIRTRNEKTKESKGSHSGSERKE